MKSEFFYPSSDGVTSIHAIEWIPTQKPKAVLQISHGMVEYIGRYDEFAEYLCEKGFYVVGQDHLGHGRSVSGEGGHGYFHKEKGNEYVVGDIHKLRQRTKEIYPDIPYFLLGHSMGSFLTRQYIQMHGSGLSGVIIMGTGYHGAFELQMGRLLCRAIAAVKGDRYRSRLVNNLAFGGYNRKFRPARTEVDWLTKDTEIVDRYQKDPWCTFLFTVNAYYHMFTGMLQLTKKQNVEKIPKKLPILFVAGADDPVGNFGKGVDKVYRQYKRVGIKDVSLKLYPGDRHEILNETDRQQVYEDIGEWLEKFLKGI